MPLTFWLDKYSMDIKELHSFKLSDAVKFHSTLNPVLWRGQRLEPAVKKQLLVIAQDFLENLGINNLQVEDVRVSGSNAAFTYTPHSDLDLHILVDMTKLSNDAVYHELFNAKKTLYNDTHNITIRGVPVELYIQDSNQPVVSLGEYSVLHDKWIKIPSKRKAHFDQNATRAKFDKLAELIDVALKTEDIARITKALKIIKRYRQAGLDKGGEFSPENLAYKAIRSQGGITKLYALRDELHSKDLSIESMYASENKNQYKTDDFTNKLAKEFKQYSTTDEDYDPNGPPPGPESPPEFPAGTVKVDVSDVYDWYKLGQSISDLDSIDPKTLGKGPPQTVLTFGSEPEEHKYMAQLKKLGLTIHDIDPEGYHDVDESYQPPSLSVGDKILKGKFKNSPAEIKGFKKDKHNQPVLKTNKGEVQLFKPRISKLMPEGVAEGSENLSYIGNCTDDDVIEHIFGDATGFAQAVDEYGDEFTLDDLVVKYDPETDVHSFYYKEQGVAEGSLEELANTSLKVKEPKDFVNVNDRKQVTWKVMKFKSGKDTYLINFTMQDPPAFGKKSKSNWNAVNVAFGVKEPQDEYSFGDEINTDLTAKNKNQFLIYSTVINAVRKFITEYNTEIDEIIMQGAGERQAVMYQRFFQSAGKYFPGWHHDGKHSLVRDVPRQTGKKVKEQGVAEDYTMQYAAEKTSAINPYGGLKDNQYRGSISEEASSTFVYHVTPTKNIKSIAKQGLVPTVGGRASQIAGEKSGIYVFPDKVSAEDAVMNWLGDEFDEEPLTMLKIDVSGLENHITKGADYELIVGTTIDPKRIKKVNIQLEEASGYIPSEKEKNDPRFKTALTVDVKPDSIKKNAKAFSWLTNRAGIPPTANPSGKV